MVKDPGSFGEAAEKDRVVSLADAKAAVGDWEEFIKRNRINPDTDAIYMDKVKKDDDRATLDKIAKDVLTGWVIMDRLDDSGKKKAIDQSSADNRIAGWDRLDFDEMNETCAKCKLSWDKGRGCIGAFGPDNSLLPEIASRHGCPIVASAPESAASGKRYAPDDADELAREVKVLIDALPEEGKVMVRRYSGPLERLAAVAEISKNEKCGFYFF